jgi:hypothetical protein
MFFIHFLPNKPSKTSSSFIVEVKRLVLDIKKLSLKIDKEILEKSDDFPSFRGSLNILDCAVKEGEKQEIFSRKSRDIIEELKHVLISIYHIFNDDYLPGKGTLKDVNNMAVFNDKASARLEKICKFSLDLHSLEFEKINAYHSNQVKRIKKIKADIAKISKI